MRKLTKAFSLALSALMMLGAAVGIKPMVERANAELNQGGGTYTLTPTGVISSGKYTNGGVEWTFATDNAGYNAWETDKIHMGSGSKAISYYSFATSAFSSFKITKVSVTGYDASGDTKLYVSVDDISLGDPASFTSSSSTVFISNSNGLSGDSLLIKVARPSTAKKAIYFKGLEVTYVPNTGEDTGKNAFDVPDISNWEIDSVNNTIFGLFDDGVDSYTVGIFTTEESTVPLETFIIDSENEHDLVCSEYGTYFVRVKANENATHYASGWSGVIGSFVSSPEAKTISDFRKLTDDKNKYYSITGVVRNIQNAKYGNFDLVDVNEYISNGESYTSSSNYVYIYGCKNGKNGGQQSFEDTGITIGDVITMYAYKTSYNDTIEGVGYFVEFAGKPIYNVKYHVNSTISSERVYKGEKITKSDPIVDGFIFDGWYLESTCVTPFNKTSSVGEDLELYAKLTDETAKAVALAINDVSSHLGLSYMYKYGNASGEFDLAVPNASSSISWGENTIIDISDGFSGNTLFKVEYIKNGSSSAYFGKGTLRLYRGADRNGGAVKVSPKNSNVIITNVDFTASNLEDNGEITSADGSFILKNISTVASGDASRVDVSNIAVSYNFEGYSDVDFRVRVAIDDISTLLTTYTQISDYGISVATSSKSKDYSFSASCLTDSATGYKYTVISLGDVFNNPDRLEESFTAKAFVVFNGQKIYSNNPISMSVVDMVKYYNDNGYSNEVADLYGRLIDMGLIN